MTERYFDEDLIDIPELGKGWEKRAAELRYQAAQRPGQTVGLSRRDMIWYATWSGGEFLSGADYAINTQGQIVMVDDGISASPAEPFFLPPSENPTGSRLRKLAEKPHSQLSQPASLDAPLPSRRQDRPSPMFRREPRQLVDDSGVVYEKPIVSATPTGFRPVTQIGGIPVRNVSFDGIPIRPHIIGDPIQASDGPMGGPAVGKNGRPLYDARPGGRGDITRAVIKGSPFA